MNNIQCEINYGLPILVLLAAIAFIVRRNRQPVASRPRLLTLVFVLGAMLSILPSLLTKCITGGMICAHEPLLAIIYIPATIPVVILRFRHLRLLHHVQEVCKITITMP